MPVCKFRGLHVLCSKYDTMNIQAVVTSHIQDFYTHTMGNVLIVGKLSLWSIWFYGLEKRVNINTRAA